MADVASLSVKLGLVTVEWDAATEKAKRQAKDLKAAFDNLGTGFGKAADMWRQFGSIISVSAMTALVTQTAAFADEIVDIGKSFDLTTQQVLSFRDALANAGVNADGAAKMLSTLYSKIDEGRQGNDKTIAQFEKLGITYSELKNLDTYKAIQKVAQGFSNVADSFERVKMIKEFFGKGGVGLSIEQINEALSQGTTRYDEYADAIKKVGVISDNMKRSFDNLKLAVADLIKPFAGDFIVSADRFKQILQALAAGTIALGIGRIAVAFFELQKAIQAAAVAGAAFNLVVGGVSPIGLAIKLLAAGATAIVFFAGASDNKGAMANEYLKNPAVADQLKRNAQSRLLFTKEPEGTSTEGQPELSKEAQQKSIAINLARQQLALEKEKYAVQLNEYKVGEQATQLALADIARREKILAIDQKRKEELNAQRDGTEALKGQINALADVEIAKANAEYKAKEKLIQQTETLAAEQRKAQAAGRDYADLAQMNQEMADYLAQQQQLTHEIRKQFTEQLRSEDITRQRMKYESELTHLFPREKEHRMQQYDLQLRITQFMREQKDLGVSPEEIEKRADALERVLQKQIDINVQTAEEQRTFKHGWNEAFQSYIDNGTNAAQQAGSMFASITGNMDAALSNFVRNGKFSFKDFARSVIQDLILIQARAQMTNMMGMFFRSMGGGTPSVSLATPVGLGTGGGYADGGDPPVGRVSLVGERGPELFVPKTAGTIIPNNQLASAMGGGQTINYNGPYIASMNAIDTQSGTQFLARNKQAVWGAYQSANRSVPVTR
jgi:lambda family phage tail tape measure protein